MTARANSVLSCSMIPHCISKPLDNTAVSGRTEGVASSVGTEGGEALSDLSSAMAGTLGTSAGIPDVSRDLLIVTTLLSDLERLEVVGHVGVARVVPNIGSSLGVLAVLVTEYFNHSGVGSSDKSSSEEKRLGEQHFLSLLLGQYFSKI